MKKITISLSAILTMVADGYRAGKNLETGGLMVGPKDARGVISDVIPSSSHAERQAASFFQSDEDVKHLNRVLKHYHSSGKDFMGYYHQHPPGVTRLSSGDLDSCRETLEDSDYAIDNELLMVIICVTEELARPPVFLYRVSLGKFNRVLVEELSFEIIPDKCIKECRIEKPQTNKEGDEDAKDTDNRHGTREVSFNGTGRCESGEHISLRL